MLKFTLAAIMLIAPVLHHTARAAQQKKSARGPVVSAYLTNLQEEINELDFQLRHQEISRRDYERARARLLLQQRYVTRLAAESNADFVPELQVLTADEIGALMLGGTTERGELSVGATVGENWKVVAVEQRAEKFFVLERTAASDERKAAMPGRKAINPLDVIETVRVEEPEEKPATSNRAVAEAVPAKAKPVEAKPAAVTPQVEAARPQIRALYLPRYTAKAREKNVEGQVVINALFGRDGKVRDLVLESKLGYGLDESAVAATKQIRFEPARLAGEAVDVRAQVIFTFAQNNIIARIQPLPNAAKRN